MLFGGDGTHCFARKKSRAYKKEELSSFLTKFLYQSQPSTSEPEPWKAEVIAFMAWSCRHPIGWYSIPKCHLHSHLIQFQSTVNQSIQSTYSQLTGNHDLLRLQRRKPVDSRFWSQLCCYYSKWSGSNQNNQLKRNTRSCCLKGKISWIIICHKSKSLRSKKEQRSWETMYSPLWELKTWTVAAIKCQISKTQSSTGKIHSWTCTQYSDLELTPPFLQQHLTIYRREHQLTTPLFWMKSKTRRILRLIHQHPSLSDPRKLPSCREVRLLEQE